MNFLYPYKLPPTQFKAILTANKGLYAHNNTLHSLSLYPKTRYYMVVKYYLQIWVVTGVQPNFLALCETDLLRDKLSSIGIA